MSGKYREFIDLLNAGKLNSCDTDDGGTLNWFNMSPSELLMEFEEWLIKECDNRKDE